MSTMIARPCDHCQARYAAEVRYLKRGQGLYCSRSCSSKAMQARRERDRSPNVTCSYCSVPFYTKPSRVVKSKSGKFFCSVEHQNLAYKERIVRTGPPRTGRKRGEPLGDKRCLHCNDFLSARVKDSTVVHNKCKPEWQINEWLSGNNDVTHGQGGTKDVKSFVKKYLIETRGDKCEQCGFDEKAPDGRSIIQMDHIDGNCMNNLIENLRLLCPNHHAMTPNYGSLNKGSGRAWRRKAE